MERQKGSTQKSIAQAIGVSEATVSREIRRNGGKNGSYNFIKAQEKAEVRSHRSPGNRAISDTLKWRVRELLTKEQWSPKQISGRLKKEGHEISYETIYAMIRADETGELAKHCRHKMKYDKKIHMKHETKATNIKNRVSIHERPPEADGTRFGDWEMDLIVDKDQNAILTLVERSSDRFLMEKLKHGKQAMPLAKVVWRLLLPYKGEGLKTITTDNGSEFAAHEWLSKKLGVRKSLVIEWIYRYRENGESAFTETKVYSAELKRTAVEEYLSGGKSLYAVSAKYGIQSYSTLKRWIKVYNSGGDLSQRAGGRHMKTGRKTTQEERISIAKECLENECNYEETARKHNVSYNQVYIWVKKYKELGESGLEDRRGKRTEDQEPRSAEEEMKIRIAQLEHELYMTKLERDLLKKLDELERRDAFLK